MLGREGRRAIAVIEIGVILAACSSAAASIAASPSSTAIALPKIGERLRYRRWVHPDGDPNAGLVSRSGLGTSHRTGTAVRSGIRVR